MNNLFEKLTDTMKNCDKAILVAHQCPDLDALGSCLGLSSILSNLNVENYIYLDIDKVDNYSVNLALPFCSDYNFINNTNYESLITDNTYLVILDTHIPDRIENPELLDKLNKVIVLDHHIKNRNYIKETELLYIDSTLSSVVELIAFYANYLNINIPSIISSIMLAGMEVDTNGFNVKVTEQTFSAASILLSMGADMIVKQNLLKESKREYLRKANFIKSSYIYHKKYAFCLLDSPETSQEELAEIAESLLNFENVEASFSIGQLDKKTVGVSARSIGNIDVCEIMKQFGGGGHTTNAATQIEKTTMKLIEKNIKKVLGD